MKKIITFSILVYLLFTINSSAINNEEDIKNRDRIDTTRSDGPLICAEGAVVINTSSQSLEEVVETMERIVRDAMKGS